MTAGLQTAVLVLFGAALIRLASGDQLARYVRPGTRPLVLAAGVVMCALGITVSIVAAPRLRRSPGAARRASAGPGVTRAVWLLLGPVISIAVVAPPALGVLTAGRAPVAPPRPSSAFAALPAVDPIPMTVSQVVLRTVWHAGDTLRGRTLRIVGFVARTTPHGFTLARLVITCCAADARPYDIDVDLGGSSRAPPSRHTSLAGSTGGGNSSAADVTAGQWVAVTGRYLGPSPAGPVVPALRASSVVPIPQPANPYD